MFIFVWENVFWKKVFWHYFCDFLWIVHYFFVMNHDPLNLQPAPKHYTHKLILSERAPPHPLTVSECEYMLYHFHGIFSVIHMVYIQVFWVFFIISSSESKLCNISIFILIFVAYFYSMLAARDAAWTTSKRQQKQSALE